MTAPTLTDELAKHTPVIGRFAHLNAIVGCSCLNFGEYRRLAHDRVFYAGFEDWKSHLEAELAPVIEAAKADAVREALAEVDRRLEEERDYWSDRADRADTGIQVALNGATMAGAIRGLTIVREVRAARGGETRE